MAPNFRMTMEHKNKNLKMKLQGDFDRASACELLEVLKKNAHGVNSVSIDTDGLGYIYHVGREMFLDSLSSLSPRVPRIQVTGKKAGQIVPERRSSR